MKILSRLGALIRSVPASGASGLDALIEAARALFGGDRETRRNVAFSVAMIALSAKMAKADGVVTPDEVGAFLQIFSIPPREMRNVFRLYDLAKQDTAGFESYATRIRRLCTDADVGPPLLADVLDGLFHIAKADGVIHERELVFLERIGGIFGLTDRQFLRIRARHVAGGEAEPYAVLGIEPDTPPEKIRSRYLQLVRDNHPDALTARGVPDEFLAIATERMKAINAAYETLTRAA